MQFAAEVCPLYPRKRTCAVPLEMSALGQKRTCVTREASNAEKYQSAALVGRHAFNDDGAIIGTLEPMFACCLVGLTVVPSSRLLKGRKF